MADLTTLYHPHALAPDGRPARVEVPANLVDRHVHEGWLKSEPHNAAVTTAEKATAKAKKAAQAAATEPVES